MHLKSFDGEVEVIQSLSMVPITFPEVKQILLDHGCTLQKQGNEYIVTFPEGSTRTLLYPHVLNSRYRIILPDGVELRQVADRFQQKNFLDIVIDSLPDKNVHRRTVE